MLLAPFILILAACGEHRGEDVKTFNGDYRYDNGIGEFFDCESAKKYYVINTSENEELIEEYQSYQLDSKHDIYIRIKGYLKEVPQLDGIDPMLEFAPVELLESNPDRGCVVGGKHGY